MSLKAYMCIVTGIFQSTFTCKKLFDTQPSEGGRLDIIIIWPHFLCEETEVQKTFSSQSDSTRMWQLMD